MNKQLLLSLILSILTLSAISQWTAVGEPNISDGYTGYTSLAVDKNQTPYLALCDISDDGKPKVFIYEDDSWKLLGDKALIEGNAKNTHLTLSSEGVPYVAFNDYMLDGKVTVMKFDGDNWIKLGDVTVSESEAINLRLQLSKDDVPYVAYINKDSQNIISLKKFDGNNWISQAEIEGVYNMRFGEIAGFVFEKCFEFTISDDNVVYLAAKLKQSPYMAIYEIKDNSTTKLDLKGHPENGSFYEFGMGIDKNNQLVLGYKHLTLMGDVTYKVFKYANSEWRQYGDDLINQNNIHSTNLALDKDKEVYVFYESYSNEFIAYNNGTEWVHLGEKTEIDPMFPSFTIDQAGMLWLAYVEHSHFWRAIVKKQLIPITIYEEPKDIQVCKGDEAQFSLKAAYAKQYQWQVSNDEGENWENLTDNDIYSGVKTSTLTIKKATDEIDGLLYSCQLKNSDNSKNSSVAKLSLKKTKEYSKELWQEANSCLNDKDFFIRTHHFSEENIRIKWFKDGVFFKESSTEYIDISAVPEHEGTYHFEINNGCETMVSNNLELKLKREPEKNFKQLGEKYYANQYIQQHSFTNSPNGTSHILYEQVNGEFGLIKFENEKWTEIDMPSNNASWRNIVETDRDGNIYICENKYLNNLKIWKRENNEWLSILPDLENVNNEYSNDLVVANKDLYYAYTYFDNITVLKYENQKWNIIGKKDIAEGYVYKIDVDANGVPYVYYNEGFSDPKFNVARFVNNTWETIGNQHENWNNEEGVFKIDHNNIPYILTSDKNNKLVFMRYHNNKWEDLLQNNEFVTFPQSKLNLDFDADNMPYISFENRDYCGSLTLAKWDGSQLNIIETTQQLISSNNLVINNNEGFLLIKSNDAEGYYFSFQKFGALPRFETSLSEKLIVCSETEQNISIKANNATAYQWQKQIVGSSEFKNIVDNSIFSGSNKPNLKIKASENLSGLIFRCMASNNNGEVNSNTLELEVTKSQKIISSPPDTIYLDACIDDLYFEFNTQNVDSFTVYHNNIPIKQHQNLSYIYNVSASHAGKYQYEFFGGCNGSQKSHEMELIVNTNPTMPDMPLVYPSTGFYKHSAFAFDKNDNPIVISFEYNNLTIKHWENDAWKEITINHDEDINNVQIENDREGNPFLLIESYSSPAIYAYKNLSWEELGKLPIKNFCQSLKLKFDADNQPVVGILDNTAVYYYQHTSGKWNEQYDYKVNWVNDEFDFVINSVGKMYLYYKNNDNKVAIKQFNGVYWDEIENDFPEIFNYNSGLYLDNSDNLFFHLTGDSDIYSKLFKLDNNKWIIQDVADKGELTYAHFMNNRKGELFTIYTDVFKYHEIIARKLGGNQWNTTERMKVSNSTFGKVNGKYAHFAINSNGTPHLLELVGIYKMGKIPRLVSKLEDQVISCSNTKASFTVEALDAESYQWQSKGDYEHEFTNIDPAELQYQGINTSTLSINSFFKDNIKYRCVVTNKAGSISTNYAKLHIKNQLKHFHLPVRKVYEGDPDVYHSLKILNPDNISVQWYNEDGPIEGEESLQLRVESKMENSGTYYCMIKDECNNSKKTAEFTLQVEEIIDGNLWKKFGAEFTSSINTDDIDFAFDNENNLFLAYSDLNNEGKITVMKHDGLQWHQVGKAGFTSSRAKNLNIKVSNNGMPCVSYEGASDCDDLMIYSFNGFEWQRIPQFNGITNSEDFENVFDIDENNNIYALNGDYYYQLNKFDGQQWQQVNAGTEYIDISQVLLHDNELWCIATERNQEFKINLFKAEGENWIKVADNKNLPHSGWTPYASFSPEGKPYILLQIENSPRVYTVQNNEWIEISQGLENISMTTGNLKVSPNGTPYIMTDNYYSTLLVLKYNGTKWEAVGETLLQPNNSNELNIEFDNNGTPFILFTNSANGTDAEILHYTKELIIGTQPPKTSYLCQNMQGKCTLKAYNVVNYIWQKSLDKGKIFSNIEEGTNFSNINTATLTIHGYESLNDIQVRCIVVDENGEQLISEPSVIKFRVPVMVSQQPTSSITTCQNDEDFSIALKVTDTESATFQWYKDNQLINNAGDQAIELEAKLSAAGKYYCVVDSFCGIRSEPTDVIVNQQIRISEQSKDLKINENENAKLSIKAFGDALQYQWHKDKNALSDDESLIGTTTNKLEFVSAKASHQGNYTCVITGICGSLESEEISVIIKTTGIDNVDNQPIAIYPNPTKNLINIECQNYSRIEVCNIDGKLLKLIDSNSNSVDLSSFKNGIYLLKVYQNNKTSVFKIIKE